MEIYKMMKHLIAALMSAPFCFSAFAQAQTPPPPINLSPEELKQSNAIACIMDYKYMLSYPGLTSRDEVVYIENKLGRLAEQATHLARLVGPAGSGRLLAQAIRAEPPETKESLAAADVRRRHILTNRKTYCINFINNNGL